MQLKLQSTSTCNHNETLGKWILWQGWEQHLSIPDLVPAPSLLAMCSALVHNLITYSTSLTFLFPWIVWPGNSFCSLFTGKTCDSTVNYCECNPCFNGGSCQSALEGYFCHCPFGEYPSPLLFISPFPIPIPIYFYQYKWFLVWKWFKARKNCMYLVVQLTHFSLKEN